MKRDFPKKVYSGCWPNGHCQGIAVDKQGGYMYFSFTTALVKTDLEGNVIGSAVGLLAHLGCIAFFDEDGCVYGSLEYKNDEIGRGIEARMGSRNEHDDAFYIARFDVSKIDRVGMDVFADGVMTACYLKEVVDDYKAVLPDGIKHHLGCSGIDGLTFAPLYGAQRDSRKYLYVAYGVYGDVNRQDNDYQVILCYDVDDIKRFAQPLDQDAPHHVGIDRPYQKLFAYTGNTTYGVQNMEYDPTTGNVLLAVYVGKKPQFPNLPMYVLDGHVAPVECELRGVGERGLVLTLAKVGEEHPSGVNGLKFEYGSTGIYALGDGEYYFSHDVQEGKDSWSSTAYLYRADNKEGFVLA